MSLYISSLNSGSNGNCYYIGNKNEAVLVDVGISCREVEKRITRSGLSINKVKAIFISHEHIDHIRGVEVISRKYQLPVYITEATRKYSRIEIEESLIRSFKAYEPVRVGNLSIVGFPKLHDAADPHSFIVNQDDLKIGVFTDIGSACDHVIKSFRECHAAFLETNYDDGMLEKGNYPFHLKKRIRSDKGHLSNDQALDLFIKHSPAFMSHLLLSHLSKENNCPDLVMDLFNKHTYKTRVVVASRYMESEVFQITKNHTSDLTRSTSEVSKVVQMSLF